MGPLSAHMLQHIILMNVLAPAAMLFFRRFGARSSRHHWIFATLTQVILLWLWHAPPLYEAAASHPMSLVAMHLSLAFSACWFWLSVFSVGEEKVWQGIVAILLTGKLFCLLGALLVFSPRLLYQISCFSEPCRSSLELFALADQQMAGSLMLIACPMSYVVIGTVMAARWFSKLERQVAGYG